VRRCSRAVGGGPESGRAGASRVVAAHVDDVAGRMDTLCVAMGKGGKMGARGASRGGLGCVGRLLGRC
jgi:hypothetical protein